MQETRKVRVRVPMEFYMGAQMRLITVLSIIYGTSKEEAASQYARGFLALIFSKIFEPIEGS